MTLLLLGSFLAKNNTVGVSVSNGSMDSTTANSKDSTKFVMPKFDEQAIMEQQRQQMLSQMTPAQRAKYQQEYLEYMQQMQMQEEYLRQKEEYERQMENGEFIPPVSQKTQSKIEQLKEQFRQKQIKDSLDQLNKAPSIK